MSNSTTKPKKNNGASSSSAKSTAHNGASCHSNQIWRVAKFEITRQIKKPAFWIAILLLPLLIGGIFLISYLSSSGAVKHQENIDDGTTIAITDEAGIIPVKAANAQVTSDTAQTVDTASNTTPATAENTSDTTSDATSTDSTSDTSSEKLPAADTSTAVTFKTYPDQAAGEQAVKDGEVDLYFYIPADFQKTKKVYAYKISKGLDIFSNSENIIKNILTTYANTRVDTTDAIVLAGDYGIEEIKFASDGQVDNVLGRAIIPLAILVIFFLFVCIFGNRLLMTVVEEKENRISEMILTAISAKHLIIGKIIAMIVLGMIQIAALIIPTIIIVFLNQSNEMVSGVLSIIELDPIMIIQNLVLFIFSILLFTGFCTLIGTLVPTARDASQFIAPVIIGVVIPFYFIQTFMLPDGGAIVEFLTYFPLSAPTAMMLRSAFGTLSTFGFYLGLIEIIILSIIVIRLTVKIFQKHAISFDIVNPKLLFKKH